jgi:hypothetical protein
MKDKSLLHGVCPVRKKVTPFMAERTNKFESVLRSVLGSLTGFTTIFY